MAVDLSFNETGSGDPVIILHGLFGSKRNWSAIGKQLGRRHRVLTIDLRNHGESPWDSVHTYPAMAEDVARLIEAEAGGSATVVGHSMGGKVAMILALTRPDLVERLVVVDIAPAPSGGTLIDYIHTMQDLPIGRFTRRSEVETALADTIPEPGIRAFLSQNVKSDPDGLSWMINLDALEANFDAILDFPEIPEGTHFKKPTLFIAGEKSDYIRPHHQAEIDRLFPHSELEVIARAGHWVHAEAPGPFIDVLTRFLPD